VEKKVNGAALAAGKTVHSLKEREHLHGFSVESYVLFNL